jgi:KWG Leptospira.
MKIAFVAARAALSALAILAISCATIRFEAPPDGVWDAMGDFGEGLVPVQAKGLWGYADVYGKLAIAPQFAEARGFSGGRAAVRLKSKWGYIDTSGKYAVPPRYLEAGDYAMGLAAVKTAQGWGYVDPTGDVIVTPAYDEAGPFGDAGSSGDLAPVRLGQRWGYIDRSGRVAIGFMYKGAGAFSRGLAPAASLADDDEWGYIDRSGRYAIQPGFDGARPFSGDRALVLLDGYWGYIDDGGKLAVNPRFESALDFAEELAPARSGGLWGLIDRGGNWRTEPRYAAIGPFRDGWARASLDSGRDILIDEGGGSSWLEAEPGRDAARVSPSLGASGQGRTVRLQVLDYFSNGKVANFKIKEALGEEGRYDLNASTGPDGVAELTLASGTKVVFCRNDGYFDLPLDVSDGASSYSIKALSSAFELPRIDELLLSRQDGEEKKAVNVLFQQEEFECLKPVKSHIEFRVFEGKFSGKVKKYFLQQGSKRVESSDRSFDLDVGSTFSVGGLIHAGVVIDYLDTAIVTKTLLVVRDPAILRKPIAGPPDFGVKIPDKEKAGYTLSGLAKWEFPPFLGGITGGVQYLPANVPPLNFNVEYGDDKVRITIGVAAEKAKGKWDYVKRTIDQIKEGAGKWDQAAANAAKSFGQQAKRNGSGTLAGSAGGLGYIELKWDGGLKLVDGVLMLYSGIDAEYTTYWFLYVPIYVSLGAGGKISIMFQANRTGSPTLEDFFTNVTFSFEPYVDLEAGVGVKGLASIGIALNASLPMAVKTKPFAFTGNLVLDFMLRLRFLYVFSITKELAKYSLGLWDLKSGAEGSGSPDAGPQVASGPPGFLAPPGYAGPLLPKDSDETFREGLVLEDQDYAGTGRWVGDSAPPAYTIGEGPPISHQPIKENILPGSEPFLILHDGVEFLFWIDNAGLGRSSSDRSVLMFSRRASDGSWPTGQAVDDDGTGDYDFSVVERSGELYVAWQNSTLAFREDWKNKTFKEVGEKIAKNSEIKYAAYDEAKRAFGSPHSLRPHPGQLHAKPRLAADGSDLMLAFELNSDADPLLEKASSTAIECYSIPGGKLLRRVQPAQRLIGYDAIVSGGAPYVVALEDEDGSLNTIDDRAATIYCGARFNGSVIRGSSSSWKGRISNPRIVKWRGSYVLFCFESDAQGRGNYRYTENLLSPELFRTLEFWEYTWTWKQVFDSNRASSEDFSLLKGPGDSLGILYLDSTVQAGEREATLQSSPTCIVWDPEGGKWSLPVRAWLAAPDPVRRAEAPQGLWHAADHIDVAYRSLPAEPKEGEASPPTNLDLATIAVVPDLKIGPASLLRYFEPADIGNLIRFDVEVLNQGLAPARGLFTNLWSKSTNVEWEGMGYDKAYKHAVLRPGERALVHMAYRVTSFDGRTVPSFSVAVRSLGKERELYTENNTAEVKLVDPVLAFGPISMSRDRYARTIEVELQNKSPVRIEDIRLSLKDGDSDVAPPIAVGTLMPNKNYKARFSIDIVRDLRWGEDSQKALRLEASSGDIHSGPKRVEACVVVNPYKYPPFSLAIFGARTSGSNYVWVDAAATNVYPDERSGSLAIEVLDENDKPTGDPRIVELRKVPAGGTRLVSEIFRTPKPVREGYKVRVSMPNSQKALPGDVATGGLAAPGGDPEPVEAPVLSNEGRLP